MKQADVLSRLFNVLIIAENNLERNLTVSQDLDEHIVRTKSKLQI